MGIENIERDFVAKVGAKVRVVAEGQERYRVLTPFLFDDGDHLSIVLRREGPQWLLTDEGHTFMHLTYDLDEKDLRKGTRHKIIGNALSTFGVADREGALHLPVQGEQFGDALYSFAQALLKITDVSFLSRERVKSTFLEDARRLVSVVVPEERRQFNWHDKNLDPKGNYQVDCRVEGQRKPLFVFFLPNDDRTRDATITLLQYEKWGAKSQSMAIFESQEDISRKVLARFSDVGGKQFSSLVQNSEKIKEFVAEAMAA